MKELKKNLSLLYKKILNDYIYKICNPIVVEYNSCQTETDNYMNDIRENWNYNDNNIIKYEQKLNGLEAHVKNYKKKFDGNVFVYRSSDVFLLSIILPIWIAVSLSDINLFSPNNLIIVVWAFIHMTLDILIIENEKASEKVNDNFKECKNMFYAMKMLRFEQKLISKLNWEANETQIKNIQQ